MRELPLFGALRKAGIWFEVPRVSSPEIILVTCRTPLYEEGHWELAHLGDDEHPLTVAIAVGSVLIRAATMVLSTDCGLHLGLKQVEDPPTNDLRDQGRAD